MKDERFLPVDKHEPVDDYDDFIESENSDGLSIEKEAADEAELYPNGRKLGRDKLFVAS